VVLSLFRRGAYVEELEDPLVALEAWRVHNQSIHDFCRRNPERSVLGHVQAMVGNLDGTIAFCARKLGLDLSAEHASAVYRPTELARAVISRDVQAEFEQLVPSVASLYRQMEETADLPDPLVIGGEIP